MSFISREQSLGKRVENASLLIYAAIYFVLLVGLGRLTGLPRLAVVALAAALAPFLLIAVRRKLGPHLREWLDGGY